MANAKKKVVTFGEAMLRLVPPLNHRIEQAHSFDTYVGGGELNVAVACARLGLEAAWVSRLPESPMGRLVRNRAREFGVDTSHIAWSPGGRIGLYFLEMGAAPRTHKVFYDREYSAISKIRPGEIDWQAAFAGASLFHVSGITPGLSATAAEATTESLQAAKKAGLRVTYDLNYRTKLWSEQAAQEYHEPVMEYVDVLITSEEDTERVFKIKEKSYEDVAKRLADKFGFQAVAITLRDNISVWRNDWTAIVYDGKQVLRDVKYQLECVDRLGGGDSYAAGFIYGWLTGDLARANRYGNAVCALKHSQHGDFNLTTPDEVESLLAGQGDLRIER